MPIRTPFSAEAMYCDLCSQYIKVRKLFKGGNYSRKYGNCFLSILLEAWSIQSYSVHLLQRSLTRLTKPKIRSGSTSSGFFVPGNVHFIRPMALNSRSELSVLVLEIPIDAIFPRINCISKSFYVRRVHLTSRQTDLNIRLCKFGCLLHRPVGAGQWACHGNPRFWQIS